MIASLRNILGPVAAAVAGWLVLQLPAPGFLLVPVMWVVVMFVLALVMTR